MEVALQYYLKAFKRLRVDRSHGGVAPHKPILLLSILQAVKERIITSNQIYLTPELISLFRNNWSRLVYTKHDCRISYPFYYLKSEKFWKLVFKEWTMDFNRIDSLVKNINRLNTVIDFAIIDNNLFSLMQDNESNNILIQCLLAEYFPNSSLDPTLQPDDKLLLEIEHKILHESEAEYRREIKQLMQEKKDEEIFLRGSLFKREIPKIYNNTCCISGMRIDTISNISMIDACHIVPFSESYNDTITNGIALCPNLHRAFDRGLIAVDDNYQVIISSRFKETSSTYQLRIFENKQIHLPREKAYYPQIENFKKHRRKWDLE